MDENLTHTQPGVILPTPSNTVPVKPPKSKKPLVLVIAIHIIVVTVIGYFVYQNVQLKKQIAQTQSTPIASTTPTPAVTTGANGDLKNFTTMNSYFINSPLINKISGSYTDYGQNKPKRFSADITDLIKQNYNQIKIVQEVKPPAFSVNIWSYDYFTPTWVNDNKYVSFQENSQTILADIGIRAKNNNYPFLSFLNFKKEFRNISDNIMDKTTVFSSNNKAVVITWSPSHLEPNGYDDHPSMLATMYVESPNSEKSSSPVINTIQLLVSFPSYIDADGKFLDKSVADPKSVQEYQNIIDSYFNAVIDIFNKVEVYYK